MFIDDCENCNIITGPVSNLNILINLFLYSQFHNDEN